MLNGQLYRALGRGGEPGHYRVVPDGRLCGCGSRGCWEQYVSGNALVAGGARVRQAVTGRGRPLLQLAGAAPRASTARR